jgi:hypothetical protein
MARQKYHEGPPDVVCDSLVLKESMNVEEIARVLTVERRCCVLSWIQRTY